jgi:phospholipid/cholesterol/gamma-HCH transport system ATP-binding protein
MADMNSASEIATAVRSRIEVRGLDLAYGDRVIQRDLNFTVEPGDIFVVMGPSGSGKSTLVRCMIGLVPPVRGDVYYDDESFWTADADARQRILRRVGVLYQEGALWSSMTLTENVGLVLEEFIDLPPATAREVASLKLALVGLAGFEDFYPSEISGGMRKRAGLARAMALDPDILFFDEPSAGLDPITSRRLDDLILELRDSLGATVVMVTHELASIFAIGTNSVFLDEETKTITAAGNPMKLLHECRDPKVHRFLTRGEKNGR